MHLENECVLRSYKPIETEDEGNNDLTHCQPCKTIESVSPTRSERRVSTSDADSEDDTIVSIYCKFHPSELDKLPESLTCMMSAIAEPLPHDYNLPPPPSWLDLQLLQKGQAFALKYFNGVSYSQTLSLLLLFASPEGLKPLIFTEKSHTASLACKRYLSTTLRVKSWYDSKLWESTSKGYKNLKAVRALHLQTSDKVNGKPFDEVHKSSNLEQKLKKLNVSPVCPLLSTLRKDFVGRNSATFPIKMPKHERVFLNQLEMGTTQFGFFGLILLYPEKFAAKNATEEEFSGFVHLWRYIGYMLGVKDEFNVCRGSLHEVRQRCRHMLDIFIRPTMLNINKEWEHMSRCALQGIEKFTKMKINFESTMLYFCWVMDIETPHLFEYVSWKEIWFFNLTKFMFTKGDHIPGFRRFINYCVLKNLEHYEKQDNLTKSTN